MNNNEHKTEWCKKIWNRAYSHLEWHTEDVIAAAKNDGVTLTEEQAAAWLTNNEKGFRDALSEYGNEFLSNVNWEKAYEEHLYSATVNLYAPNQLLIDNFTVRCIYTRLVASIDIKPGTLDEVSAATSKQAVIKMIEELRGNLFNIDLYVETTIYKNNTAFAVDGYYVHNENKLVFNNAFKG